MRQLGIYIMMLIIFSANIMTQKRKKKLKSLQKRIIASNHVCAGNDINEEDVYNISLTLYYQ